MNLRQIEVFKAVIDHGTVSSAASALNVSQPAMSKSLAQLEADSELRLFDRVKGRLVATAEGLRLYAEVERIFSGVQQVEDAIDALHRQARGRISIGVMPALSGAFVQRVVTAFLQVHPGTYCHIETQRSDGIIEALVGRRLDVGLLSSPRNNPYLDSELLAEHAVVCIMPVGHSLAARRSVTPADFVDVPFVSFATETETGHLVAALLAAHGIHPNVALVTTAARTLVEFVASGNGVALVHPLMVGDFARVAVRPFEPSAMLGFRLFQGRATSNARLTDDFIRVVRATAGAMLGEALVECTTLRPITL